MGKFLFYAPIYPPQTGGAALYFSNLGDKIEEHKDIIILTTREPGESYKTTEGSKTVYRLIPRLSRPPLFIRTAVPSLIAAIFTLYLIITDNIKAIHSHSTANAVPGLALTTLIFNIPLFYDCRDENFPLWLVTFGNTAHWFSCSSNIDDRLNKAGVPEDRITRIPVVNPEYVSEYTEESGESVFSIIFVGTVNRNKGVYILLDAFEKFQEEHNDVRLEIVGAGPELEAIQQQVSKTDYAEDITIQGRMTHRETLSRISKSDVLVLPSKHEGLPRVLLEALELETPIIATPVGDVPDLINDRESGMLVGRDSAEVAEALDKLYSSPKLRQRLRKNGSEQMDNQDWGTVRERIVDIYEKET